MKNDFSGTQSGFSRMPFAVELRNITKTYAGCREKANNNINLGLRRGEILCIAGENGAGKTTLMKILCGMENPDEGEIYINGRAVTIDSPLASRRLGIGMVHQHFMLFPQYTAAENIVMGMEPRKWGFFFDRKAAEKISARIIDAHHFSIDPGRPVYTMSVGEMQQVEICRLLLLNADIIILDEPTSVLTEYEITALFTTLKTLASAGKSIFLITHKLPEVKRIADRVAVLRHGEIAGICEGEFDEYMISKTMVGGSDVQIRHPHKNDKAAVTKICDKPVIVFDNVTVMRRGQKLPLLDSISFAVRPGEIMGFTGVGGNGLGVLEAVLGGFLHPATGSITHNGEDISSLNMRRLRNRGLAYVPSDRLKTGTAPEATVEENIIVNRRSEFTGTGFLNRKLIHDYSENLIRHYNITGTAGAKSTAELSGGNIQKLVLGREIGQIRDYIVFSEPTWGLDYAAGNFVRDEIALLREKGTAVILISTNIDEILSLADRIIVMYKGRAAGEFNNSDKSDTGMFGTDNISLKEKIGTCMQGIF